MRRLLQLLARLYPAEWRARYGAEYAALLEEREPRWRDVVDVAWAAVKLWATSWSFVPVVLPCVIAGGLVAVAFARVKPPQYTSQTTFMLASGSSDGICGDQGYFLVEQQGSSVEQRGSSRVVCADAQIFGRYLSSARGGVFDREFLALVIQKEGLYPRERARKPMEAVIDEMRRNIRVTSLGKSLRRQFAVRFNYPDAHVAQVVDEELAAQVIVRTLNDKLSKFQAANSTHGQQQLTFLQERLRLAKNATEANYLRDAIAVAETAQSVNAHYRPLMPEQIIVADGNRLILVLSRDSVRPKFASLPQRPDGLNRAQMSFAGLACGLLCGLSLAAVMRPGRGASISKG